MSFKLIHPSIKFIILFTLLIISPFLIFMFTWKAQIPVAIVYAHEEEFFAVFSWNTIIQFLVSAILLPVVFYLYMRKALLPIQRQAQINPILLRKTLLIETLTLVFSLFLAVGEFAHKWNDPLNFIDKTSGVGTGSYNGADTTQGYVMIYFGDEWVGHWFIMVSYFGMILLAIWVELILNIKKEKYSIIELISIAVGGVGLGILNGMAAILSETGIILCVLQLGFLVFFLGIKRSKSIKIRDHPLLMCMLVATPIVVISNIAFILLHGWSPLFPYYSANLLH